MKDPVASESDFIIATLYRVILANYKNDILAANALVNTASAWYEVSKGGADCRASALAADAYTTTNRAVVYPLLLGRFARKASKLTIYEEWSCADAAKQPAFLALLGDAEFTRLNVANYVEQKIVGPYIEAMLARSADSLRGRLLLALVNVTEHKTAAPSAVTFLRGQADTNGAFSPELVAELNGYSENVLRTKLGMAVASVTAATGGTPTKNISTSANVYVEPMRPRRENMTKAGLFDRAQILTEPRAGATKLDDQYFTKEYTLVGEVKKLTGGDAGWYQLRMDNGTVAYMEKRFF